MGYLLRNFLGMMNGKGTAGIHGAVDRDIAAVHLDNLLCDR